jgi:hypothetical protein
MVLAMKGETADEEIRFLSESEKMRYKLKKTVFLFLPFTSIKRTILLFVKE